MIQKLRKQFFTVLDKRKNNGDEELYLFTLLMTVGIATWGLLLLFIPFQIYIGATSLVYADIAGQFTCILTLYLIYKKHYDLAGLLQVLNISLFSLFALWILGGGHFIIFYFITGLMMILIIPFKNRYIKPIFIIIHGIFAIFAFYLELYHAPQINYEFSRWSFSLSNLLICFVSIICFVLLEKGIRHFIDSFHKKQLHELRTQANVDPLTKLYNRRFADAYFAALSKNEHTVENHCVAIADLDNFKQINDTYGHDCGDAVLLRISEVMRESIRKSDYVFRWGGEEFLITLTDATRDKAKNRMETIRQKVELLKINYHGTIIKITITIGVCALDVKNIQASIIKCDEKLYEGKQKGKNIVVL